MEWFETDTFWRETYDFLFPENRFSEAEQQIDQVIELSGVSRGLVLDLCCGPGRCSLALAKRGLAVTGVDLTPFLLDKAREKAGEQNLEIEWIGEDMRKFIRPDHYDLVINMFTSFGYFENRDDDLSVLQNMYASLKPGGRLLMEMMSKEILAKIYQPTLAQKLPHGALLVERPEIKDGWSRVVNEWMIINKDKVTRLNFQHNLYSGQELKTSLTTAGFKKVDLYGGLDGREYGPEADRLVAVAVKETE